MSDLRLVVPGRILQFCRFFRSYSSNPVTSRSMCNFVDSFARGDVSRERLPRGGGRCVGEAAEPRLVRMPSSGNATAAPLLVYSWQPLRHLAGGSDGARHAGMSQRLMQIVRAACRLGFEPTFISGQPMHRSNGGSGSGHRGTVWVGGCRVSHYYGSTAAQYAQMSSDGVAPLFALIFYTAAWFAVEQRAIRNSSGWALPEAYLDEEQSSEGGLGGKEVKLLSLLRAEHPHAAVAVLTDDIQSDKLRSVLPAARSAAGDDARVEHVTQWMERRECGVYAAADATVTVSAHDAAWVRHRLRIGGAASASGSRPLVMSLPFVAYPPPPRRVAEFSPRSGMLYCGVAHTSAAQSMRWFLSHVHPPLVSLLRNRLAPRDAALHARVTIVGWGWKDLARFGPGCSASTEVRGRGTRCVGAVLGEPAEAENTADNQLARPAAEKTPGGGLIDLHHAVDDEVLAGLFGERRVFIAPCHACTGVATKVVTALRHGIPVVCTSEATRGITDSVPASEGGSNAAARRARDVLSVHDEPDQFAAAVAALLTDEELWRKRSLASLRYARSELSEGVLDTRMGTLLRTLASRRCAASGDQAASACQYAAKEVDSSPSPTATLADRGDSLS